MGPGGGLHAKKSLAWPDQTAALGEARQRNVGVLGPCYFRTRKLGWSEKGSCGVDRQTLCLFL
jgi:hypothetical protein